MLLCHWHPAGAAAACPTDPSPAVDSPIGPDPGVLSDPPLAAHLHGRDLVVMHAGDHCWHWRVASPHGIVFAEGDAPTRDAAEQAAEDEATAIHPPTDALLDRLLG